MHRHQDKRSVDVVDIVKSVRRTIEKREARFDNAGRAREKVRARLIHKIQRAQMPEDVRKDLIDSRMEWLFDSESFWWSRRPGVGPLINLFRRFTRPIVKLFFNPDVILHHLNRLSYLVYYQQQLLEDLMVDQELHQTASTPSGSQGRRPNERRSRRNSTSRNRRQGPNKPSRT